MKHWSLFLVPLILVSLSAQADVLSSGCSAGQVAVGSAVNGATGINSRCSAASAKQRATVPLFLSPYDSFHDWIARALSPASAAATPRWRW